jgi:3-oxoacyl-(acyl-carrier-protein) synthase
MASGQIAMRFGARGPNYATTSACASGAHALGEAMRLVRDGVQDVMIAGGAEAPVTLLGVGGFAAMRALATSFNAAPERASRPFDKGREGFVVSEGAAILVLETAEHAAARGARPLAEFVGYASNCDAYHMTQPSPEGEGAAACMAAALADADVAPERVDYVNAHGTSTPYNDEAETIALKRVFGAHARRLAISSTKSMTGHLLGASGAVEAAAAVLAIAHGVIPPTINPRILIPRATSTTCRVARSQPVGTRSRTRSASAARSHARRPARDVRPLAATPLRRRQGRRRDDMTALARMRQAAGSTLATRWTRAAGCRRCWARRSRSANRPRSSPGCRSCRSTAARRSKSTWASSFR